MNLIGILIGFLIGGLFAGLAIWVVGRLGLGLSVSGFGPAFILGFVIAILNSIVAAVLGALGISVGAGLFGAILQLLIAAAVIMASGSIVRGVSVKGFVGAIVAAIVIAVMYWLLASVITALAR